MLLPFLRVSLLLTLASAIPNRNLLPKRNISVLNDSLELGLAISDTVAYVQCLIAHNSIEAVATLGNIIIPLISCSLNDSNLGRVQPASLPTKAIDPSDFSFATSSTSSFTTSTTTLASSMTDIPGSGSISTSSISPILASSSTSFSTGLPSYSGVGLVIVASKTSASIYPTPTTTLEDGVINVNITRLPNLPYYLSPGGAIVPSQYVDNSETFEISVFTLNKRCSQSNTSQKFSLFNPYLYPTGWLGLNTDTHNIPISSELQAVTDIGPGTNIWSLNCTSGALTIPGFSLCLSIGHIFGISGNTCDPTIYNSVSLTFQLPDSSGFFPSGSN